MKTLHILRTPAATLGLPYTEGSIQAVPDDDAARLLRLHLAVEVPGDIKTTDASQEEDQNPEPQPKKQKESAAKKDKED